MQHTVRLAHLLTSDGNTFLSIANLSLSGTIGLAIVTFSIVTCCSMSKASANIYHSGNLLLERLPQPLGPLSESAWPFPSNTTRGPMLSNARLSSPLPSPSPVGSPESSKSALNDSMWGVTNSFRISYAAPSVGGCLNLFSRRSVSNVGPLFCLGNPSGIIF